MVALDAAGTYGITDWYGQNPANKAQLNHEGNILTLAFTSGTSAGDELQSLTSTGSLLLLERTVVIRGQVTLDKLVSMSDFAFDLGTRTLSAQVAVTDLLRGLTTDHGFLPIFSAASLVRSDVTAGNASSGEATFSTAGPLIMNSATTDTLLNGLFTPALYPSDYSRVTDLWNATDWGTFSGQATLSTVPEPSSLWLSSWAGLAGRAAGRAGQRQAHCSPPGSRPLPGAGP